MFGNRFIKHLAAPLFMACVLAVPAAQAAPIAVSVDARSGPWPWTPDILDPSGLITPGLNSGYSYGENAADFLPPTKVLFSSLGLSAGDSFSMLYLGGLTSAFGGPPSVDNAGHVGTIFKDDVLGSSGSPFPSLHTPDEWGVNLALYDSRVIADQSGVFLNALMWAILDIDDEIVGLGSLGTWSALDTNSDMSADLWARVGGLSFALPLGAHSITFGVNDDIFKDNTGALRVCLGPTGSFDGRCNAIRTGGSVPSPGTIGLLGAGLVALSSLRLRKWVARA